MSWDKSPAEARELGQRPSRRKAMTKKDTRRWCRGHEGREHLTHVIAQWGEGYTCRPSRSWTRVRGTVDQWQRSERWFCQHVVACAVCGKHLATAERCPDMPEGWAPGPPVVETR